MQQARGLVYITVQYRVVTVRFSEWETFPREFATPARLSDPFGLLLGAALQWHFFVSGLIIPIVVSFSIMYLSYP
jgi:hypothetical protein